MMANCANCAHYEAYIPDSYAGVCKKDNHTKQAMGHCVEWVRR